MYISILYILTFIIRCYTTRFLEHLIRNRMQITDCYQWDVDINMYFRSHQISSTWFAPSVVIMSIRNPASYKMKHSISNLCKISPDTQSFDMLLVFVSTFLEMVETLILNHDLFLMMSRCIILEVSKINHFYVLLNK